MVVVGTEYHRHRQPRLERFAKYQNESGTSFLRATNKHEMLKSHWLLEYLRSVAENDACKYGWVKKDEVLRAYRHQFRDAQGRTGFVLPGLEKSTAMAMAMLLALVQC